MINRTEEEIVKNWGEWDINNPLVSILCITYNHENFISQALDGFLMQKTNFPFEVIVHDDASTDYTANIIREYERRFPNIIKPIYEVENQYSKPESPLDDIINRELKGEYIALCEGDDYWTDEMKLQEQYDLMEKNPEMPICFCRVRCVDVDNNDLNRLMPPDELLFSNGIVSLKELIYVQFALSLWPLHTSSYFCQRNVYFDYMNNRPECYKMFPYGDMPILLYMLSRGDGGYINKEMSCYRMLAGGFMSSMKKDKDFAKKVSTKLISALEAFDKEMNYQYHDSLQVRIGKERFNIANIDGDFKSLVKKENKLFFKNMTLKFRINSYIKAYFPGMKYIIMLKRKYYK